MAVILRRRRCHLRGLYRSDSGGRNVLPPPSAGVLTECRFIGLILIIGGGGFDRHRPYQFSHCLQQDKKSFGGNKGASSPLAPANGGFRFLLKTLESSSETQKFSSAQALLLNVEIVKTRFLPSGEANGVPRIELVVHNSET